MKHCFYFKYVLLISCLTILVLFSAYSLANAKDWVDKPAVQLETEKNRSETVPGGPGFISIHPMAFRPRSPLLDFGFTSQYELYNPSSSDLYATAPVYLPHGADVNQVVLNFYDNTMKILYVWLFRTDVNDGTSLEMASISTAGSPGYSNLVDTTINGATIDNQDYAYFVQVFIPGSNGESLKLTGVRIDYEYPGYLPCVTK